MNPFGLRDKQPAIDPQQPAMDPPIVCNPSSDKPNTPARLTAWATPRPHHTAGTESFQSEVDPTLNDCAHARHPYTSWRGYSNTIAAAWMIVSIGCVALAVMMRVGDGRQVHFLNWPSAIPETCMLHHRFGIDCPGCGLTRCFIHMAHGQPLQALSLSAVGVAVFFFTVVQIPLGFCQVVLRKRGYWIEQWGRWNDWIVAALLLALLLQWPIRLALPPN